MILRPNFGMAHYQAAVCYDIMGQPEHALAEAEAAQQFAWSYDLQQFVRKMRNVAAAAAEAATVAGSRRVAAAEGHSDGVDNPAAAAATSPGGRGGEAAGSSGLQDDDAVQGTTRAARTPQQGPQQQQQCGARHTQVGTDRQQQLADNSRAVAGQEQRSAVGQGRGGRPLPVVLQQRLAARGLLTGLDTAAAGETKAAVAGRITGVIEDDNDEDDDDNDDDDDDEAHDTDGTDVAAGANGNDVDANDTAFVAAVAAASGSSESWSPEETEGSSSRGGRGYGGGDDDDNDDDDNDNHSLGSSGAVSSDEIETGSSLWSGISIGSSSSGSHNSSNSNGDEGSSGSEDGSGDGSEDGSDPGDMFLTTDDEDEFTDLWDVLGLGGLDEHRRLYDWGDEQQGLTAAAGDGRSSNERQQQDGQAALSAAAEEVVGAARFREVLAPIRRQLGLLQLRRRRRLMTAAAAAAAQRDGPDSNRPSSALQGSADAVDGQPDRQALEAAEQQQHQEQREGQLQPDHAEVQPALANGHQQEGGSSDDGALSTGSESSDEDWEVTEEDLLTEVRWGAGQEDLDCGTGQLVKSPLRQALGT
jgi:hypothetical protein